MADIQTQLVLAQNQHAFIQDSTKGVVQVYAGPHMVALSSTDRPVVYDVGQVKGTDAAVLLTEDCGVIRSQERRSTWDAK